MARRTPRAVVVGRALAGALLSITFATTGLVTAQAAPAAAPTPVARLDAAAGALHAGHDRARRQVAQDRSTLAREAEEEGEDTFLSLAPSCAASAKKSAKPHAVLYSTRKATFSWVLTSTSGLRRTGTVKVKRESVAALELPSVRTGSYRVVLTEKGAPAPAADETFDVALCVVVKTSCHAVRFTNPASNPPADLSYGTSDERAFDLRLAPGASRTVRVDDKRISFSAWADLGDDEDAAEVNLGTGTVKVPQSCKGKPATPAQNAVQTEATVGCGTATTKAPVTFSWVAQKSLKNRTWQVLDASSEVVATGSFRDGRDQTVQLASGAYTYRALANKQAEPFEQVAFDVLRCVEVTPACRALEIQNPNAVAVALVAVDPDLFDDPDVDLGDDPESDQLQERTLAAGAATTLAWTRPAAVVLAFDASTDEQSRFLGLASPFPTDVGDDDEPDDVLDALPRVVVPQDC